MEIGAFITNLRRSSEEFNSIFEALHNSENEYSINGSDYSQIGNIAEVVGNAPENILGMDDKTFELITEPGKAGASLTFYTGAMSDSNLSMSDILPEEFVHLYQNLFYVGEGSFNYDNRPEGVNIEFEAKLIAGIIKKQGGIKLLDSRNEESLKAHGYAERLGVKYYRGRNLNNYAKDMETWINQPSLSEAYKSKDVDFNKLPSILINILTR